MNTSEDETIRQFRSVKEAAAAFSKYHSTLLVSSPSPSPTAPPSTAASGSAHKSTPVYYEVSVMDSIKRLEMELAEVRQELALMRKRRCEMEIAMAGINARFHRSLSKLAEIEAAKAAQRNAIREEKRWEEDDENHEYWPCFGDALSICDMDVGIERKKKKPLSLIGLGRIFSKKSSSDDTDYTYPQSIYSVLS